MLAQDGHHVLVGDFNLHHPRWGCQTTMTHHKSSETLLEILYEANMGLIPLEGTFTWKIRGSQSTFDLTFISKELEDTIIAC